MNQKPVDVDAYIAQAAPEVQPILTKLRATILKAAPKANERMSYGMPFYEYGGKGAKGRMIYFGAFKKHIGVFIVPGLADVIPAELGDYHAGKATYQFPLNQPFPYSLIAKTVKAIVKERDQG